MRGFKPRIRHQLAREASLGESLRDAQSSLDIVPLIVLRRVEMPYAEPMVLGGMDRSPEFIEARVVDLDAPEAPVNCGSLCHFVWKPAQGGAQITSIDGMSVAANSGKKYRFTFRLTFAPAGGFNGR